MFSTFQHLCATIKDQMTLSELKSAIAKPSGITCTLNVHSRLEDYKCEPMK